MTSRVINPGSYTRAAKTVLAAVGARPEAVWTRAGQLPTNLRTMIVGELTEAQIAELTAQGVTVEQAAFHNWANCADYQLRWPYSGCAVAPVMRIETR